MHSCIRAFVHSSFVVRRRSPSFVAGRWHGKRTSSLLTFSVRKATSVRRRTSLDHQRMRSRCGAFNSASDSHSLVCREIMRNVVPRCAKDVCCWPWNYCQARLCTMQVAFVHADTVGVPQRPACGRCCHSVKPWDVVAEHPRNTQGLADRAHMSRWLAVSCRFFSWRCFFCVAVACIV